MDAANFNRLQVLRSKPGAGRDHTHEVVLGDVNGDGVLDILTTNVNDHNVSVLLGDGKGQFAPASSSPVQVWRNPYDALVLRDLDGDGKPDLVTPNIGGNKLDVLRGDGKGGFTRIPGAPFPVAERPGYVKVADVNNDGKLDLLATHDDVGLLAVMLNDGNGGFRQMTGSPFHLSGVAWGFDVGDLNGDGNVDVVSGVQRSGLLVLLGDGKGGFTELKDLQLPVGTRSEYAVLADLNRDGKPEIIVSNYGSGDVSIFLAERRSK